MHARRWCRRFQSREAAEEQTQRRGDATACSPGAASWWLGPAIDTARAEDRGGNCGRWPQRPHAGSHRLLCAARGRAGAARPDSGACHLAGEQSLAQRSGLVSRAGPLRLVHTPVREQVRGPAALLRRGVPEQIRSCAPDQDAADGPAPGAGSRPIG